jgi:hypothetical protein
MKHINRFNENTKVNRILEMQEEEEGPWKTLDFFTDLEDFHKENDVHSSCHTTLDNFVSFLTDKYTREVINTILGEDEDDYPGEYTDDNLDQM